MIRVRDEGRSYQIFYAAVIIFMVLVMAACVLPYLYVVSISFNDATDTMLGGVSLIPREFTLQNYIAIFSDNTILHAATVSVIRVIAGTFIQVGVTYFAAYAFRKRRFPGRTWLLFYFMIPAYFNAGIIANYILYSRIKLLGSFLVYLLPVAFNFFFMVLIRTFLISSIPVSLEESATIDGATEFTIMRRIFIPLSKPIIATIALYSAVYHWNDWTTTLLYADKNPSIYTLQYILMKLLRDAQAMAQAIIKAAMNGQTVTGSPSVTPESIRNAQIVITTIPIILVYPFVQRYFIKGIMIGAVKE